jgi:hypothetical protein
MSIVFPCFPKDETVDWLLWYNRAECIPHWITSAQSYQQKWLQQFAATAPIEKAITKYS